MPPSRAKNRRSLLAGSHRLKIVRQVLALFLLPAWLAAQGPDIGIIDFYGLRKVTEKDLRAALGAAEGDKLPRSKGDVEETIEDIPGVVRARLEAVCCDEGKAILYVGVEERGAPYFPFRDPPSDLVLLPEEIHETYVHFLSALGQAVREKDTDEDLTQGHSLMHNAACRSYQEQFLDQAKEHLDVIRDVLKNSIDEEHRAIAAYVIGYAPDKKAVVDDLLYALRDPDDTVRNNAMRALAAIEVLAKLKPTLEIQISPTWFIEMLNSIIWTDRTTAAVNLVNLTETHDPEMLAQIRERALDALIDMARWKHLPHALPGYILLGRVLEMEETAIQEAWSTGKHLEVVEHARQVAAGKNKKN